MNAFLVPAYPDLPG